MLPRTKVSGRHERRIAYMAEIDMDVRELVAERDALREALEAVKRGFNSYYNETGNPHDLLNAESVVRKVLERPE